MSVVNFDLVVDVDVDVDGIGLEGTRRRFFRWVFWGLRVCDLRFAPGFFGVERWMDLVVGC